MPCTARDAVHCTRCESGPGPAGGQRCGPAARGCPRLPRKFSPAPHGRRCASPGRDGAREFPFGSPRLAHAARRPWPALAPRTVEGARAPRASSERFRWRRCRARRALAPAPFARVRARTGRRRMQAERDRKEILGTRPARTPRSGGRAERVRISEVGEGSPAQRGRSIRRRPVRARARAKRAPGQARGARPGRREAHGRAGAKRVAERAPARSPA